MTRTATPNTLPQARLCVLTTSFPRSPGDDAGVFVARLVEALALQGATGLVLVPRDASEPHREQHKTFEIRRFRYGVFRVGALAFGAGIVPNLRRDPSLILQAPFLLLRLASEACRYKSSYDVLQANWIPSAFAAWMTSLVTGRPYIVTLRGEDVRLLRKSGIRYLLSPALHRASYLVSVNSAFLDDIEKHFPDLMSKALCIPNGVDVRPVSAAEVHQTCVKFRIPDNVPTMLFVGTVIPRKSIETLIRGLADSKLHDTILLVAGRTEDRHYHSSLVRLTEELTLTSRVMFLGAVAPSEIPSLLSRADLYVSASTYEGRPNALLEAMASRCACLVSDIPAHREIIQSETSGRFFDSIATFVTTASELLSSKETQTALGDEAKRAVAGYTWDACASAYLDLVRQLVPSGAP